MKYAGAKKEAAPHFIVLEVAAFDPTWEDRPRAKVVCGLRTIGAGSVDRSRAQADDYARKMHGPNVEEGPGAECYNDTLIREWVSLGICDPNNVESPPPWMKVPDSDSVFFTPEALKHIFDELQLLHDRKSVAARPLDDGDVMRLATLLAAGTLDTLPHDLQASHRRHLRGVFDDLLVAANVDR